ncbi:G-type lectin S-receptor-like serine/threonine-protein kinase [Melia azedarach]|uniref:G-type lectin S-receptor-like serine/threonine-protein kinase n=1 Tax=Melia azedarach TaxID=155640 RepID=A0ACC1YKJ3_MELAZ|nr:G-type lectin S-receptor-like serine/threonine-protein kinase [Melia azedarach]
MKNPYVQLMDTGNLVVKDRKTGNLENLLWQSFDHPCDTLLPGVKLGRSFKTGKDRYLSSWKSPEDPAPGQFSLWIDPTGFPQLVLRQESVMLYRAGSWNGQGFTGSPARTPNVSLCNFQFVMNETEVSYECDTNGALVSRLWVDQSGGVVRYIRSQVEPGRWVSAIYAPVDQCDIYSTCGANGRCLVNRSSGCVCLKGFATQSLKDWSVAKSTKDCIRETQLNCT